MAIIPPDLAAVISGIITLGANGGEQLFLPKIHTVLYQMKEHDRMLSGLWFSITGSVCYSRDIENVLRKFPRRRQISEVVPVQDKYPKEIRNDARNRP